MDKINDKRIRRCPRLGNDVPFAYCREPGEESPCFKLLDCWWEIFDIKNFVERNYSKKTIQKFSAPPKPKTSSLLEMIQEAENRIKKK